MLRRTATLLKYTSIQAHKAWEEEHCSEMLTALCLPTRESGNVITVSLVFLSSLISCSSCHVAGHVLPSLASRLPSTLYAAPAVHPSPRKVSVVEGSRLYFFGSSLLYLCGGSPDCIAFCSRRVFITHSLFLYFPRSRVRLGRFAAISHARPLDYFPPHLACFLTFALRPETIIVRPPDHYRRPLPRP